MGRILPPKTRMGIVWTQVMLSWGQIWCQQLVVSIKPVTDRLLIGKSSLRKKNKLIVWNSCSNTAAC